MDLQTLFTIYYTMYRGQAQIPSTSTTSPDPEFLIFINYANEAIQRWASYDNTYWRELFTSLATTSGSGGESVIVQNQVNYTAPDDMYEVGGYLRVLDPNTGVTVRRYQIIEPQQAQFLIDTDYWCYFTGDPQNGFTMTMNPAPDSSIIGFPFDYIYYKLPTLWSSANPVSQGTVSTEMTEPMFIVHRALANRFRATRNPYYNTAKSDGEDVLRIMQMKNNSGNWADPWQLQDNSGTIFGQENAAIGY